MTRCLFSVADYTLCNSRNAAQRSCGTWLEYILQRTFIVSLLFFFVLYYTFTLHPARITKMCSLFPRHKRYRQKFIAVILLENVIILLLLQFYFNNKHLYLMLFFELWVLHILYTQNKINLIYFIKHLFH